MDKDDELDVDLDRLDADYDVPRKTESETKKEWQQEQDRMERLRKQQEADRKRYYEMGGT